MPELTINLSQGYTPLPPQREFHKYFAPHPRPGIPDDPLFEQQNKFALLSGGFRSGKTVAASRQCIRWACYYPGSLGFVGRLKATELHDSTWRTFRRELELTGLLQAKIAHVTGGESKNNPAVVKIDEFEVDGVLYGGSTIVFRNFQSGGGLLGTEPDWFFLDEAGEIPDEIINTLIGRLSGSPTPHGLVTGIREVDGIRVRTRVAGPLRGIFASNPGESAYLRKVFRPLGIKGTPEPGHKTFEIPTLGNPHLSQEYVDSILARYPEGSALRKAYIEGNWSAFAGQLITNFDHKIHVVPDILGTELRGYEFVEGIDFGWRHPTAYVLFAYDPKEEGPIYALECYQRSEATAAVHAVRIRDIRAKHGVTQDNLVTYGDPSGINKGTGGTSWIVDFTLQGIPIAPMEAGRSQPARDRRIITLLSKRYETKDGEQPALVFCKRVVDDLVDDCMLLLRYSDKGSQEDGPIDARTKKDDDLHDAAAFGAMGIPVFLDDMDHSEYDSDGDKIPELVGAPTQAMIQSLTWKQKRKMGIA